MEADTLIEAASQIELIEAASRCFDRTWIELRTYSGIVRSFEATASIVN